MSGLRTVLRRALPPSISLRRYLRSAVCDGIDSVFGRRDELIPPSRWIFDGSTDRASFEKDGKEFLGYFVDLCDLGRSERILDAGCGIGRKAVQLMRYLDESGSYEGFDIVPLGIKWCRKGIAPHHRGFHFHHSDVYNSVYNPSGRIKASEYRFPFEADTFDFAFSTSLFTHMLPQETKHYLSEMSRVLRPGGRCLNTFLLCNDETTDLIERGKSEIDLPCTFEGYRYADAQQPEAAVCYDETFVSQSHLEVGLEVRQPIFYGSWCGRTKALSFQDIVIADKPLNARHSSTG